MAHSTRSQKSTPPTEAELEIREKRLEDRENTLREQAQALYHEREQIDKQQTSAVEINSLVQTIGQLQADLSSLKSITEKFNQLEKRVNDSAISNAMLFEPPPASLPPPTPMSLVPPTIMKIKDVLPMIPNFDGHRVSVYRFAKACERAKSLIPAAQEIQLVQLIVNKLEGDAYDVVEGTFFDTVTGLTDKLKAIFAPCR